MMNIAWSLLIFGCFSHIASAGQYDLNQVLQKSILFYEAQRSGKLPSTNRISWRGDSALGDKGDSGEDLSGGWYDAGDHVKFNFPMAWSVTTLAWGGIEFKSAYQSAGEFNNLLDSLRWPLNYFIKCHTSPNVFYGQVGDGYADHSWWGRPEDMTMSRPAYKLTTSAPGSDLAAETAAALAASSILFKDAGDTTYATTLLSHARSLYDFAYNYRGKYSDSISNANGFYSSSGYEDELAWGAAWLYRATNENAYLTKALQFANQNNIAWAYSWDSKVVGYQLLLHSLGQTQFKSPVETFLNNYFPGGNVPYTPKGLVYRDQWGSNRYAASAAFIATVASKKGILATNAFNFARNQINYLLGSSGRSFVVGFGTNPPKSPHHRAASCPNRPAACGWNEYNSPNANPQVLNGALVGGPNQSDGYTDARSDHVANEVACDYNAGFQGAVAGLKSLGY